VSAEKRSAASLASGNEERAPPKRTKKSKAQKAAEIARAEAGQASLDRGEELGSIDPREAARLQALSTGAKVTRADFGFSFVDSLQSSTAQQPESAEDIAAEFEAMKSRIEELKEQIRTHDDQRKTTAPKKTPKKASKKSLDLLKVAAEQIENDDEEEDEDDSLVASHEDSRFLNLDDNDYEIDEPSSDVALPSSTEITYRVLQQFDSPIFGQPGPYHVECSQSECQQRMAIFDANVRRIVRRLKVLAAEHILKLNEQNHFLPFVRRLVPIINNADEDWLVETVLCGIPDSTKLVFGKDGFNASDIVSLPRLAASDGCHKGIYIDVVANSATGLLGSNVQLYVGSAAGKYGIAQRWACYISAGRGKTPVSGLHNQAIFNNLQNLNIRALADYGDDPIRWLPNFSESIFMLLLGTVRDTGIRKSANGEANPYCTDELYKCVAACREGFPEPIGEGLNSTWSLKQGFKMTLNSNRACCINCGFRMVPRGHVMWREVFSRDSTKPGESVICKLCHAYALIHNGVPRPQILEERMVFRKNTPSDKCMWNDCGKPLVRHVIGITPPAGFSRAFYARHPIVTDDKFIWVCRPHSILVNMLIKDHEKK
jgi:hypothetical protein